MPFLTLKSVFLAAMALNGPEFDGKSHIWAAPIYGLYRYVPRNRVLFFEVLGR